MKSKTVRRTLSTILAIGVLASWMFSAQAKTELDENFSGTLEDVFGTDLRTGSLNAENGGEYILNKSGLLYNESTGLYVPNDGSNYGMTYYTIVNGSGIMKKVGDRTAYEKMGWKVDFSEAALAYNTARIEETGSDETATNYITNGTWDYVLDFTSTGIANGVNDNAPIFVFQKDGSDVFALIASRNGNGNLGCKHAENANQAKNGTAIQTIAYKEYGYYICNPDTNSNKVKISVNMDEKSLNLYKFYNNKWVQVNVDAIDISGYSNMLSGFNGIAFREQFHSGPVAKFHNVSFVSDTTTLFSADFEDATKSWMDYGFNIYNDKSSIVYGGGKLLLAPFKGTVSSIDKPIGKTVNSGIFVVEFATTNHIHASEAGSGSATFNGGSGNWTTGREMIQFRKTNSETENIILGIGNTYPFAHTLGVGTVNGTTPSSLAAFNSNFMREGGKSYILSSNGTKYKFVIDFDEGKLYTYITAQGLNGYQLVNPDGYTLPENFSFDNIRLQVSNNGKSSWGSFGDIKMYSLASINSGAEVQISCNGEICDEDGYLYAGNGDIISSEFTVYANPAETKKVALITVVYDAADNSLTNIYKDEKIVNSGTSILKAFNTITENLDGKYVKTYLWDMETLNPLNNVIQFEGVAD